MVVKLLVHAEKRADTQSLSLFSATAVGFSMVLSSIFTGKFSLLSEMTIQVLMVTEGFASAAAWLVLCYTMDALDVVFNGKGFPDAFLLVCSFGELLIFTAVQAGVFFFLSGLIASLIDYGSGPEVVRAMLDVLSI